MSTGAAHFRSSPPLLATRDRTIHVGCPSADNLRLVRRLEKGGSGSSGLEFSGSALMLQAAVGNGYTLDAFTLGEDRLGPAEVDVGRG